MKKLNQKQWGIFGTSLGSVLIIVALLTMVGIGSGDTYAAQVVQCACTTGTYDSTTNKCIVTKTETITCYTGTDAGGATSSPVCSTTSGCTQTGHSGMTVTAVWYRWSCPKTTTTSSSCTCPTGTENDGSGNCVEKPSSSSSVCKKGEYIIAGDCVTCTQGSYCPGDGSINACPSDKPKSNAGSSSISDCKSSGTTNSCTDKSIGATCLTSDGKTGTCQDSGSSSGGRICKANSSSGSSSTTCAAGTYYDGNNSCLTCTSGFYCPGGTFSHTTGDINGSGRKTCPKDKPYSQAGAKAESECTASGNGGTGGGGNGNGGTGGGGNGGNTGGNTGGSNGGNNTGGNNSGNNSNTNTNPSTATKTPLVIVVIGMIAMGLGTFTYYKSKNNEI